MGRPTKPAGLKTGHNQSKAELEKQKEAEQFIGGNNDEIKKIPKGLDDNGKKYYKFIVDNLENSGVLMNLDVSMVKQVAQILSQMDYLDGVLSNNMFVNRVDKNGFTTQVEHPAFGMKMKLLAQFKALATQLGLSPSSRVQLSNLNVEAAMDEHDPVAQVLRDD